MKKSFVIGAIVLSILLFSGIVYFQWQIIDRAKEKVANEFDTNVRKATYEVGFRYEQNQKLANLTDFQALDSLIRIGESSLQSLFDSASTGEYSINVELLDSLSSDVFSNSNFIGPMIFGVYSMDNELIYANTDDEEILKHNPIVFQFSDGGQFPKPFMYAISIPNSELLKKRVLRQEIWWSYIVSGAILITVLLAFLTLFRQNRLSVLKSEFIASMTHEIKTPIATLNLAIDTLQNPEFQKDSNAVNLFTEVLKTEIKRLHQHLNKILEASLLEKQDFELSLDKVDCVPLIRDIVSASIARVEQKDGSITIKGLDKPVFILVDPGHFRNIIYNLIDNAIKYGGTPPHIEVELRVSEKLEIVISDNGQGIANKYRNRIFTKLYRISKQTGAIEGSGLGLYYAQKMTKWMNGSIKYSPNKQKGSRFHIQFPYNDTQA